MEKKILHILNGDATAQPFIQTGIPGDRLVWREILSEGPVADVIPEEEFWRRRADYLFKAYNEHQENYTEDMKNTLRKIDSVNEYAEVVLWFEHDLVCQVNLMYLLTRLLMVDCQAKVSLVCINHFPGMWDFRGLGQLNPQQLASLYPYRKSLRQDDLEYAAVYWKAYNSENPTLLEKFMQFPNPVFPFLKTATDAHLQRFPSVTNGLGRIQQKILQVVEEKARTKDRLLKEFIQQESIYGLGDCQVYDYLWELTAPEAELVKMDGEKLKITPAGKEVLTGSMNYLELKIPERWIGGVRQNSDNIWLWNPLISRLVEKNKSLNSNLAAVTEATKKTALDFIGCINAHDVDGLLKLMAGDHRFIDAHNNVLSGKEQLKSGWGGYFNWFPDYRIEVEEVFAEENKAGIFGIASGTFSKQKNGEINSFKLPASWKVVIEENKVKDWQVFTDSKIPFEIIERNS